MSKVGGESYKKMFCFLSHARKHISYLRKKNKIVPFTCPYAGRALTFFLQQKKVSKKCRRCRKRAKKYTVLLKSMNSSF
jgi:hypothetical protein